MTLRAGTLIALLAATPAAAAVPLRAVEIESPAGAGSAEPFLAARGGRLHLTWLQEAPEGATELRTATLAGRAWSSPSTIAAGKTLLANWADFPSILPLADGSLVAHWLDRTAPEGYAYDVRVARSRDGGATWSPPLTPHRDGTQAEHGFVSLVEAGVDAVVAVWLDGRAYAEAAAHGAGGGRTALRAAILGRETFGEETVLDPQVCDCCQTSAAMTPRGVFVAYRDRSETEVRDISYVRLVKGAWTEPRTLHTDGWEIAACPVNGPAVAARGDRLAVAWFTAAKPAAGAADPGKGGGRVLVALSPDGGETFAPPLRVDAGNPAGRVDVEWLDDDTAVVVWNERGEGEAAEVRARAIGVRGSLEPAVTIARTLGARKSGFPRLAPYQDGIAAAWTDPGDPQRVRLARLARGAEEAGAPTAAAAPAAPVPLPPLEDRPAPQFQARALDGKSVALVELRGKVVVLNFWGIWCPPCREEIPELARLHHDLHAQGLEIVSVDVGDPRARLTKFVTEQKIPYAVLIQESLIDLYRVTSFPTSIVIDQRGRIRYVAEGYSPRAIPEVRRIVQHLLEEDR